MFEKASRMKLRFSTPQGELPVEDVWDIPLTSNKLGRANLDDLAKALNKELNNNDTESFVLKVTKPNEELSLKFEVVKHIIAVRLAEREAMENLVKAKEKKQQILAIIADKETESLKGKSLDELKALLESL